MRAKAVLGIALAVMLILAALPQAWAVVEDPRDKITNKLIEKYNIRHDKYTADVGALAKILESKPESELTAEEAYWLASWKVAEIAGYHGTDVALKYKYIEEAMHYADLMLQKDNSHQNQVLYYKVLARAYSVANMGYPDIELTKKEAEYAMKVIELNPDGQICDSTGYCTNYWSILASALQRPLEIDLTLVPDKVWKFPQEVYQGGMYMNLKTQEDLEKIGYYKWKQEVAEPHLKKLGNTFTWKLARKLPVIKDSREYVSLFGAFGWYILGAAAFIIGGTGYLVARRVRRARAA